MRIASNQYSLVSFLIVNLFLKEIKGSLNEVEFDPAFEEILTQNRKPKKLSRSALNSKVYDRRNSFVTSQSKSDEDNESGSGENTDVEFLTDYSNKIRKNTSNNESEDDASISNVREKLLREFEQSPKPKRSPRSGSNYLTRSAPVFYATVENSKKVSNLIKSESGSELNRNNRSATPLHYNEYDSSDGYEHEKEEKPISWTVKPLKSPKKLKKTFRLPFADVKSIKFRSTLLGSVDQQIIATDSGTEGKVIDIPVKLDLNDVNINDAMGTIINSSKNENDSVMPIVISNPNRIEEDSSVKSVNIETKENISTSSPLIVKTATTATMTQSDLTDTETSNSHLSIIEPPNFAVTSNSNSINSEVKISPPVGITTGANFSTLNTGSDDLVDDFSSEEEAEDEDVSVSVSEATDTTIITDDNVKIASIVDNGNDNSTLTEKKGILITPIANTVIDIPTYTEAAFTAATADKEEEYDEEYVEDQVEIDRMRSTLQSTQQVLLVFAAITFLSIFFYSIYYINLIRKIYSKTRISK